MYYISFRRPLVKEGCGRLTQEVSLGLVTLHLRYVRYLWRFKLWSIETNDTVFCSGWVFICALPVSAPCCPSNFRAVLVSSDTVEVSWSPVRGAEMYETKAASWRGTVLCNDTATACTLSALRCNTRYNVTVYSFSEARGSNTSCASKYVATGMCIPTFP